MGKLVRKNLILDADALRELAEELGMSGSAAVREVVAAELERRPATAAFASRVPPREVVLDTAVLVEMLHRARGRSVERQLERST